MATNIYIELMKNLLRKLDPFLDDWDIQQVYKVIPGASTTVQPSAHLPQQILQHPARKRIRLRTSLGGLPTLPPSNILSASAHNYKLIMCFLLCLMYN